jgi:hypothetical protein
MTEIDFAQLDTYARYKLMASLIVRARLHS